ncbi:hypothetical protein HAP41_0000047315 (plasmid) [Bradyrhizobium barranii subsp. apii]|uniref:Uncharacterized protein n=1 Tax=Bradyrhizobium barranii subsp. apii TaxID=2819348 RepID=A0A8U0FZK3_9BRAD|nr:hypothetical protein [Bradyrhizobium barranii]UPT92340.1 hypothetical protein HAP41_0000047315 [Bradyrhizobium barranii subsp. apii]
MDITSEELEEVAIRPAKRRLKRQMQSIKAQGDGDDKSLLHLRGRQIGRQSCELPSPHRWNAIRQRARVQPPMVEVTEKGAQRPAHRLACSRAPIPGVALNVADHVLLVDLAQGGGAAGAHLVQKPADDREMAYDGLRGQAAL